MAPTGCKANLLMKLHRDKTKRCQMPSVWGTSCFRHVGRIWLSTVGPRGRNTNIFHRYHCHKTKVAKLTKFGLPWFQNHEWLSSHRCGAQGASRQSIPWNYLSQLRAGVGWTSGSDLSRWRLQWYGHTVYELQWAKYVGERYLFKRKRSKRRSWAG